MGQQPGGESGDGQPPERPMMGGDGRPTERPMVRKLVVIIILPPMLIWVFVGSLFRGVRESLWFAWNDCESEIDSAKRYWRGTAKPRGGK